MSIPTHSLLSTLPIHGNSRISDLMSTCQYLTGYDLYDLIVSSCIGAGVDLKVQLTESPTTAQTKRRKGWLLIIVPKGQWSINPNFTHLSVTFLPCHGAGQDGHKPTKEEGYIQEGACVPEK